MRHKRKLIGQNQIYQPQYFKIFYLSPRSFMVTIQAISYIVIISYGYSRAKTTPTPHQATISQQVEFHTNYIRGNVLLHNFISINFTNLLYNILFQVNYFFVINKIMGTDKVLGYWGYVTWPSASHPLTYKPKRTQQCKREVAAEGEKVRQVLGYGWYFRTRIHNI